MFGYYGGVTFGQYLDTSITTPEPVYLVINARPQSLYPPQIRVTQTSKRLYPERPIK